MSNIININSDDFVKLSNRLEKISRADLPVAVRSTLNELAFKMKGTGGKRGAIDLQAEKDFDYKRNRTLFRVMTGVSKASGLNISMMESEAGIVRRPGRDKLAEGLAQQQKGGSIKQKATPLSKSRTGKNVSKKVRKASYMRNLDAIDLTSKRKGKFIAAAIRARKDRKPIILKGRSGVPYIAKIKSFIRSKKGIQLRLDFLYRINESGNVLLSKSRPFINRAAVNIMQQMPREFKKQANKRITKAFKK